jgi:flagellar biogenesis protein FliO
MKPFLLQATTTPKINYGIKNDHDRTPQSAYVAFFVAIVVIFVFVAWGLKKLGSKR